MTSIHHASSDGTIKGLVLMMGEHHHLHRSAVFPPLSFREEVLSLCPRRRRRAWRAMPPRTRQEKRALHIDPCVASGAQAITRASLTSTTRPRRQARKQ